MQGKILKIKTGYNPNSSSIGVDVVIFFSAGVGVTIFFNTVSTIIATIQARRQAVENQLDEGTEPVKGNGGEARK